MNNIHKQIITIKEPKNSIYKDKIYISFLEAARKLNLSKKKLLQSIKDLESEGLGLYLVDYHFEIENEIFVPYLSQSDFRALIYGLIDCSYLASMMGDYLINSAESAICLHIPMQFIQKNLSFINQEEFNEKIESFSLNSPLSSSLTLNANKWFGVNDNEHYINVNCLKEFIKFLLGDLYFENVHYKVTVNSFIKYLEEKENDAKVV